MSHSASQDCDDKIKNVIRHLYLVKGLPLQGPKENVMAIMNQVHGFKRTKQQYEQLLDAWGFKKKRKREDYQAVEWNAQKRVKGSAIYLDGKLVPMKTRRRQGSMTVPERIELDRKVPEIPMGFEIRTPAAQPPYHLAFWNLPILQFQSSLDFLKDTIKISQQEFGSLVPAQRRLEKNSRSTILPLIGRLLPIEALRDEPTASALAINRIDNLGSTEFLALTVYLMSNNFFGDSNGEDAYRWLKAHGSTGISSIVQMISSIEGFTAKALLENIFRLAVEAGDTATVEILLKTGVKPNGHRICHENIPDTMDPLQFACVTGNFEMAQALIAAGSSVQILESKDRLSIWKRSLVVLAIIGENKGLQIFLDKLADFSNEEDGEHESDDGNEVISLLRRNSGDESNGISSSQKSNQTTRPNTMEEIEFQPKQDRDTFFKFIKFLINAGAKVNLNSIWGPGEEDPAGNLPSCLRASHSPLTAASKYRHGQLVRLLLDHRADTEYLTWEGNNALQECLSRVYINDLRHDHSLIYDVLEPSSFRNGNVPGIVRDLVHAGIDINVCSLYDHCGGSYRGEGYSNGYCSDDGNCGMRVSLSPVDLAVLVGMAEVVKILFAEGTKASTHCLPLAIGFGSLAIVKLLLDHGATVPFAPENTILYISDEGNIKAVLKRYSDRSTKRFAMLAALRLDSLTLMDCVMALGTFDWNSLVEFPIFLVTILSGWHPLRMEVISKILGLGHPDVVKLWPYLNFVVKEFLDNHIGHEGAPNIKKKYGELARTALSIGIQMHTTTDCCEEACQYLLGDAMLTMAITISDNELIVLLINTGANINAFGRLACGFPKVDKQTLLTVAITARNWEMVDYLLKAGANVNDPVEMREELNSSALSAAIRAQNCALVRRLLDLGAQVGWQTPSVGSNWEIFHALFAHLEGVPERPRVVEFLDVMLSEAAQLDNVYIVRFILAMQKRNPTLGILSTTRALGYAVQNISSSGPHVIELLLDAGADVNGGPLLVDWGRKTSNFILHIAVANNNATSVEMILQAGADPNRSMHPGMDSTALQAAIRLERDEITNILLKNGADPNASSPYCSGYKYGTPLQIAVDSASEYFVAKLLEYRADPERTNSFVSHTPLQIAAINGRESYVNMLIEKGANINAPPAPDHGATALQYAVIGGFFGIAKLLVDHGADVNAAPAEIGGRTALEGAAEHGRTDIVKYLLNLGAEVHESGQSQYERALEFATSNGHHSIRELLEEHHG